MGRNPAASLTLGLIVAGTAVRLLIAPSYGYLGVDGDLLEHKQALHRILSLGFHEVYALNPRNGPALTGAEWQGGYFMNNLPGILYVRTPLAWLYRALDPAGFDLWDSRLNYFELERTDLRRRLAATRGLTVLLKLPGIAADAWIAWWAFLFASRRGTPRQGVVAAAALALGPGLIFNTAFWGQHDSVWCALILAALALVHRGRVELGWSAATLAFLSKPQALAFAPLILLEGLSRATNLRRLSAATSAAATAAFVFLPFALHGTTGAVLGWLARSTFGGEPFVSCNAANAWWLISGGNGYSMRDDVPWLGPLSPRSLGLWAFLAAYGWVLFSWRRRGEMREARLYLSGAFVALAFFLLCTELHENHMMAAVPLVALALPARPRVLGALLVVLSVSFLANLALFDPAVMAPLDARFGLGRAAPGLASCAAILNLGSAVALAAVLNRPRDAASGAHGS